MNHQVDRLANGAVWNTLRHLPDQILQDLRRLERLCLAPTMWPRSPRQLLLDLLRGGGGRFFVAHEQGRSILPMGHLLRELREAVVMPVNDSAWGQRVVFWDHAELPYLLKMESGGWVVCDDNGEPLVLAAFRMAA